MDDTSTSSRDGADAASKTTGLFQRRCAVMAAAILLLHLSATTTSPFEAAVQTVGSAATGLVASLLPRRDRAEPVRYSASAASRLFGLRIDVAVCVPNPDMTHLSVS